jgi:hypothetical protein
VTLQEGDTSWSVERSALEAVASGTATAAWQFVDLPEVTVDAAAMTALLDAADDLSAEDLSTRSQAETGLDRPPLQLTFTLRDGRTPGVLLGQAVGQDSAGYYASRGDAADVFVLSTATHKNLTDAVTRLKPENTAGADRPARP